MLRPSTLTRSQSESKSVIMGFSVSTSSSSVLPFDPKRSLRHSSIKPLFQSNGHRKKLPTNPFQKFKLLNSSEPPKMITQLPKKSNLQRVLVEKAVGFVMGSVIFIGCFNMAAKPAMAVVPNQTTSSAQKGEEFQYSEKQEVLCERLLMREPKNVEALKVILYGKMRKAKFQEAMTYVERLAEVEPEEYEWKLLRPVCFELMGENSKAKKLFKEILKERPLCLRALHALALLLHRSRECREVFVMLNEALELAQYVGRVPEERDIKMLIAQMHLLMGHLDDAMEGFKSLIDENWRDFRPYICLGIVYSFMDMKKEAEEQFEMYKSLVPEENADREFLDHLIIASKTKSRQNFLNRFRDIVTGNK